MQGLKALEGGRGRAMNLTKIGRKEEQLSPGEERKGELLSVLDQSLARIMKRVFKRVSLLRSKERTKAAD